MAVVLTNCQHKTMFFPPPGFRGRKKHTFQKAIKENLLTRLSSVYWYTLVLVCLEQLSGFWLL